MRSTTQLTLTNCPTLLASTVSHHLELTVIAIKTGAVRIDHKNKVIENYTVGYEHDFPLLPNSNNNWHKDIEPFHRYAYST